MTRHAARLAVAAFHAPLLYTAVLLAMTTGVWTR